MNKLQNAKRAMRISGVASMCLATVGFPLLYMCLGMGLNAVPYGLVVGLCVGVAVGATNFGMHYWLPI